MVKWGVDSGEAREGTIRKESYARDNERIQGGLTITRFIGDDIARLERDP